MAKDGFVEYPRAGVFVKRVRISLITKELAVLRVQKSSQQYQGKGFTVRRVVEASS